MTDCLKYCSVHLPLGRGEEVAGAMAERLGQGPDLQAVIFFCEPAQATPEFAQALARRFEVPVVGCTSAGQVGAAGFERGGVTAVGICSKELAVRPYLIAPLSKSEALSTSIATDIAARRNRDRAAFALLLVDGLSRAEDRVVADLYRLLGHLPIVGGSAGDDLKFTSTSVYSGGAFHSDAAVLTLFETTLPFMTFKLQHFVPTGMQLVITGARPEERVVTEINGESAVEEYARLVGVKPAQLDATVFSNNPVMLRLGDEYFARAVAQANADGSLTFMAAIEAGLVLSLGKGVDVMQTLGAAFDDVARRLPGQPLILGCDCILRRLEFEQSGLSEQVGAAMARAHVVGFSTYGEQFNGVHINQTFTGIAIGG